jgi:hypothetical protein
MLKTLMMAKVEKYFILFVLQSAASSQTCLLLILGFPQVGRIFDSWMISLFTSTCSSQMPYLRGE